MFRQILNQGKMLALNINGLLIIDTSNGSIVQKIDLQKDNVIGLQFSPSGKYLAYSITGDDEVTANYSPIFVSVIDLSTLYTLVTFCGGFIDHREDAPFFKFSDDEKTVDVFSETFDSTHNYRSIKIQ